MLRNTVKPHNARNKQRVFYVRLIDLLGPFASSCTAYPYMMRLLLMDSISVNKFRDNLKSFIEQVVTSHLPLKVTRRSGEDFVVVSAEDWEREQETLIVLQNNDLMRQIAASMATHTKGKGYTPTTGEMNEITGV